ncbi:MAG: glycoside hydrolase family 104 protein, partial [Betaproteobacteria bacterium]|nr:glycoside hydrolase family 104 protein [Betaproteobacteria bacterium]
MTLTTEWLKAAAEFANVKAFLRVIRERESGQGADAYLMINGGGHMAGFASHPWHDIPTTQGSKACGAYQFLGTTWAGLCEQYEFPDFSPESQDLGAIALIHERGALQDVIAGKFDAAVAKLRKVWTSLPGASESSAKWTMDKARAVYVNYGGLLDNAELLQPAAPIEERTPEVAP